MIPPPADPRTALLIGKDLGRYRLDSLLGQGGMAQVYRAHDRHTGAEVAVKVMIDSSANTPSMRERFEREWRLMQAIAHPNVISLLDWPRSATGPLYYVMELLEGETLGQRLDREERLPFRDALPIFTQLAEGLSAVHAIGSIHRDIKPQNVFLARQKERSSSEAGTSAPILTKILDFGLARVFGSMITGTGLIVGTPAYVSPEQVSGDRVDQRSDIYALGLLMYRTLTGQHPFSSEDHVTTLGHQLLSPPPPLSWLEESVPFALEALVLQCLRKRPEDRPQDVFEVIAQLLAVDRSSMPAASQPEGAVVIEDPITNEPRERPSIPPNDSYGPLNPLAESLVVNALVKKGFRRPI